MFPLNHLDQVQRVHQSVADEFESIAAVMKSYLLTEHHEDGKHADVTADSLVVAGETVLGPTTIERLTTEAGTLGGDLTGEATVSILRLHPYETWAVQTGDTDLLNTGNVPPAPPTSLWYLTRAGSDTTINGIAANLVAGNPGQVIALINSSAFTLTFESAVVTSAKRIYGCSPAILVPPGGVITFVYDGVNLGWRYLTSTQPYAHWLNQDVRTTATVTFAEILATSFVRAANLGLQALDTNGSHVLVFRPGSNLTDHRILSFVTGDADRILTVDGPPTLNNWFDQSVKQAASPTFDDLTLTGDLDVAGTVEALGAEITGDVDAGGFKVGGTPGVDATMSLAGAGGGSWDLTFVKGILTDATFTP